MRITLKNAGETSVLYRLVHTYQHQIIAMEQHAHSHGDSLYQHPDRQACDALARELSDAHIDANR